MHARSEHDDGIELRRCIERTLTTPIEAPCECDEVERYLKGNDQREQQHHWQARV